MFTCQEVISKLGFLKLKFQNFRYKYFYVFRKCSLAASKQAIQGNTNFERSGTKCWYFTSLDVVKYYQEKVYKREGFFIFTEKSQKELLCLINYKYNYIYIINIILNHTNIVVHRGWGSMEGGGIPPSNHFLFSNLQTF